MNDNTKKIKFLSEQLIILEKQQKYYFNMQPINNMGKWSRDVALKTLSDKIQKLQKEIKLYSI